MTYDSPNIPQVLWWAQDGRKTGRVSDEEVAWNATGGLSDARCGERMSNEMSEGKDDRLKEKGTIDARRAVW